MMLKRGVIITKQEKCDRDATMLNVSPLPLSCDFTIFALHSVKTYVIFCGTSRTSRKGIPEGERCWDGCPPYCVNTFVVGCEMG